MDTIIKILGIVALLLFILMGGTCVLAMGSCGVAMEEANRGQSTSSSGEAQEDVITMADFNRLQEGMSYERVVGVLGREGKVMSEGGSQWGAHTVMYSWENPGIMQGNMNAMFQNGELVSKSQFGLR